MAQLDFPPQEINGQPPLDGTIWTAPNSRQWQYDSAVPGWRSLGFRGPGVVYRGGIDLTQDPATQYANIVSGNLFTVTVGADPTDGNLYPGLGGDTIQRGDQIIFDGVEYQLIDYGQPLATETVPGIVYLATQDEVNAGTNTTDAVTPATLSTYVDNNAQAPLPNGSNGQFLTINNNGDLVFTNLPQATTTTEGITRYATTAEAIAGVEQNAAVTPNSLQGALNNALDGHIGVGGEDQHPIVTDDVAGFMSSAQKQQLEQNTTDIESNRNRIIDLENTSFPDPGAVGSVIFAAYDRSAANYANEYYNFGEEITMGTYNYLHPWNSGDYYVYVNSGDSFLEPAPAGSINYGTWQSLGLGRRISDSSNNRVLLWATLWRRIS